MREFMTRMSDYFNEWRDDPERKENRLSIVVIGAVAVVIIVLLILLLWWGHGAQEKRKEEAARKAAELQAAQEQQTAQETEEVQGLVATTYEEKMAEYMSMDSGEELRQEYLTNANALTEKIRELQTTMEKVQEEITAITGEYQDGNAKVTEKLTVLEGETKIVVEKINALEVKMTELADTIQVVNEEKIPVIQKQIGELREEIEQTRTDMAGIREKIKALEKEDEKLWERLSEAEKSLENALGENMKEIDKRMDHLGNDIDDLERELKAALDKMSEKMNERMDALSSDALSYRYEEETKTLYLMPNQKK